MYDNGDDAGHVEGDSDGDDGACCNKGIRDSNYSRTIPVLSSLTVGSTERVPRNWNITGHQVCRRCFWKILYLLVIASQK